MIPLVLTLERSGDSFMAASRNRELQHNWPVLCHFAHRSFVILMMAFESTHARRRAQRRRSQRAIIIKTRRRARGRTILFCYLWITRRNITKAIKWPSECGERGECDSVEMLEPSMAARRMATRLKRRRRIALMADIDVIQCAAVSQSLGRERAAEEGRHSNSIESHVLLLSPFSITFSLSSASLRSATEN